MPACQSIIKKAVVERLKAHYGMEQFPETGTKYQIRFSVFKDQVSIGLDASGEGLYKRGYRAVGVEAPLRETLAAALVTLSRYRGRDPFCDPFCGSGTIPIEAALIAKNRAPGLDRRFDAQKWAFLPPACWMDAADEAQDREFHGQYDIWGGDIDPRAVDIARDNARKAGVDDCVRFEVADAASVCWRGRRPSSCTAPSARRGARCPQAGAHWCFRATRSSSAASASRRTKSASCTTA